MAATSNDTKIFLALWEKLLSIVSKNILKSLNDQLQTELKESQKLATTLPEHENIQIYCKKLIPFIQQLKDLTQNKINKDCLFNAVKNNNIQAATFYASALLNSTESFTDENGNTTLHFAVLMKNIELIKALIAINPEQISVQNTNGVTPIEMAASESSELGIVTEQDGVIQSKTILAQLMNSIQLLCLDKDNA